MALERIEAKETAADLASYRATLFMCAAHCQGGHSEAGMSAAGLLGVPFPITMPNLIKAASAEGLSVLALWPWLAIRAEGED